MNHAQKRFKKRYGRDLDLYQLRAMEDLIRQNKVFSSQSGFSGPGDDRIRVGLKIGKEIFWCIYSVQTNQIITFINPKECKAVK